MSTTKPTVLFVHGSWHNPEHYAGVRSVFEQAGYPTECPAQTSVAAKPSDSVNWIADDAKVVQETASKLVNEGKDVVVVMHSYGGVVGSEAIHESLGKKVREAKGQKGGVTDLVYMCAFVIPEGSSLASALGGQLPPFITLRDDGTCWMEGTEERFFNDLSDADKKKYAELLAPVPVATQFAATTYAAYKYLPSTYLYCTNDQALPFQVQQMMVQINGGGAFKTVECDAGHSPYLSQPETVLKVVEGLKA